MRSIVFEKAMRKLFFLITFLNISGFGYSQWTFQNSNTTYEIYASSFPNDSVGYTSGVGTITKTTNGGTSWTTLVLPLGFDGITYYDIEFLNVDTGYAVGWGLFSNAETIIRTNNGGLSWGMVYQGVGFSGLYSIHFANSSVGYAVGKNGRILKTTNGGLGWSSVSSPTFQYLYGVYFTHADTGFAVGNYVILKTTDGGASWAMTPSATFFNEVHFATSQVGYAAGGKLSQGMVFKTTDGGMTWDSLPSFTQQWLVAIYAVDQDTIYVAGSEVFKTTTGGSYWESQPSSYNNPSSVLEWNHLLFLPDGITGYGVGHSCCIPNGEVIKTTNGGGAGKPIANFAAESNDVCLGYLINFTNKSSSTYSYQWQDDGTTFSTSYNATHTFTTAGTHQVSLIAYNGSFYDTTSMTITVNDSIPVANAGVDFTLCTNQGDRLKGNGGNTYLWTPSTGLSDTTISNPVVTPIATTTYYLTVSVGGCLASDSVVVTRVASDWNYIKTIRTDSSYFNSIYGHFFNENDGVSAFVSGMYKTYDGGYTWELKSPNASLWPMMDFASDSVGYAVADTGTVIKTTDAGETWSYVNFSTSDDLQFIDCPSDDTCYTGTTILQCGNFYKTTDGGATWATVSNCFYQMDWVRDIYFLNNQVGFLLGEDNAVGTIRKTVNGGSAWQTVYSSSTLPSWALSMDFATPEIGYATISTSSGTDGKILKTTDAGDTWTELVTGLDFDLNTIKFITPNTGYAAGSDGIILKTTNGGETWIELDSMCTYVDLYDIHFATSDYVYIFGINDSNAILNGINLHPMVHDAGIAKIDTSIQFCPGSNSVFVSLVNKGDSILDSVIIDWEVNGVSQPTYTWTGLIGVNRDSILGIGTFSFLPDSFYTIKAWSSMPNGVIDNYWGNDTAVADSIRTGLSGTYTVGGITPDYISISDAIIDLAKYGVCANVTIDIRSGTYNEQVVVPFIAGTSDTSSVTFKSESNDSTDVEITYSSTSSSSNYTVRIDQSDYIKFKYVTIKATGGSYGGVVSMFFGANCGFSSCIMDGTTVANANFDNTIVINAFNGTFVFKNNLVINGNRGLRISGGTTSLVENNTITNQITQGLYVGGQTAVKVKGNYVSSSLSSSFAAIVVQACDSAVEITNNVVDIPGGRCLYFLSSDSGPGKEGLIANNFFSRGPNGSFAANVVRFQNSSFQNFIHNSLLVNSSAVNSSVIIYDDATDIDVRNNIFSNINAGYAIVMDQNSTITSDYNNFYVVDSVMAEVNGVSYDSLAMWRDSLGYDSNSVAVNPLFISNSDLHIVTNAQLSNLGTPYAAVTEDIDGDLRDTLTPDMGADEFGSIVSFTVTISVSTYPACNGSCDGVATASVIGGSPPFSYTWNDSLVQTSASADSLCAGTYSVVVNDSLGYIDSASIVVVDPLVLTSAITGSINVSCFGVCDGSASVIAGNGTAPYSYLWSNGDTIANPLGLCAGINSVTVTDANGCIDTNATVVSSPSQISVLADSVVNASCNGNCNGAIYLNITGGTSPYSYNWIPSGGTGPIAANLCAGSYTVIVQDLDGCTESNVFVVNEPSLLIASGASTPTNCGDSSGTAFVNVIGGTQPYTYLWNDLNAQTTDTASGLIAGSYQVTVEDDNGCSFILPISVFNLYDPVFIDSMKANDVICYGDSSGTVTVTAGNGASPYTYSWNDPSAQTDSSATGLFSGLYTVQVIDTNGCTVSGTVQITEPPLISDSAMQTICMSDSIFLQGAYQNTSGTYTDTLGASNGCDSIHITELTVNPGYTNGLPDEMICDGDSILIFGSYQNSAGTYYDSLQTVNGCDSILITNLIVDSLPTVSFMGLDTFYCPGDVMFVDTLFGSPSGGSFSGSGISGNLFDPYASGFGTITITYTYTDVNGCTDSSSQSTSVVSCGAIEDVNSRYGIMVYPNPNTGLFVIRIETENVDLSVLNSLGQIIINESIVGTGGKIEKQLDLRQFPAGIYSLQFNTDDQVITRKVILE